MSVNETLRKEEMQRAMTTTSRKLFLAAKRRGTTMKLVKRVQTHHAGTELSKRKDQAAKARERKIVRFDAKSNGQRSLYDSDNNSSRVPTNEGEYLENATVSDEDRRKRRYRELSMERHKGTLRLRHDSSGNYVQNLTEVSVRSAVEILSLLEKSVKRRRQAETLCESDAVLSQPT